MKKTVGIVSLLLALCNTGLAELRTHTEPDFNIEHPKVISGSRRFSAWIDDDGMGERAQSWSPVSTKWTVYNGNGQIVSDATTNSSTSWLVTTGGGNYLWIMNSPVFISNGFANGNYILVVEVTMIKYYGMFFQISKITETGCFVINN